MRNQDEYIKEVLPDIAKYIDNKLPDNYGFCVLAFEFGDKPNRRMNYIANGDRKDIAKAMLEWCSKVDEDTYGKHI